MAEQDRRAEGPPQASPWGRGAEQDRRAEGPPQASPWGRGGEKRAEGSERELRQYCTFIVSSSLFGVEVDRVQEIVRAQPLTPVPLAPPAVRGLINLRGQIVPAIDLRRCLQISSVVEEPSNVIIRTDEGPVSLLVDEVGEVVQVDERRLEAAPDNLRGATRALIRGVCQLPQELLLILSPEAAISSLEPQVNHGQPQAVSLRPDRRDARREGSGGETV